MIAVDNSLFLDVVKLFIKREPIIYSSDLLNLIKYIQPPVVIGSFQIKDIRLLKQSGSVIRSVNAINEIELANKTNLKLILSKNKNNYPYVNIIHDQFESNFTATYKANANKQKILDHIKDLCQSGDKIEIYDKYLLYDNGDRRNVDDNHYSIKVVKELINSNRCKIFCKYDSSNHNISSRKNYLSSLSINFDHQNLNDHDRYIRIKKNGQIIYEIILSSGVYNILGNKDFTYVVRIF